MKCKFEHDGDCCNRDSAQYMCRCKPDICQSIVPINRYQMIRTLDDEQLFEFFLAVSKCVGCPPTNPSVCVDNCKDCWANYLESTDMIEDCIEGTQTVDPETLPIVQKLQEELARVTVERDLAVNDINEILSLTELCPLLCDWCRWNEGCDSSKTPEWRGAKEALKGEQNG